MTRRPAAEPLLPLDFRQPRKPGKREPDDLYSAIQYLRHRGVAVYRHGAQHKVDGAIADRRQVCLLAEALQWKAMP